jgi:sialic acid synthase SpsE
LKITDRFIGKTSHPFVIAGMSGKHNQFLAKAIEIIEGFKNLELLSKR